MNPDQEELNGPLKSVAEVNYRLRPAKSMERKMMVDLMQALSHIEPLTNYQYVGFGSLFFTDFRLIHRQLGIPDMHSIEYIWEAEERLELNMPYDCINLIMKDSQQGIYDIEWEVPTILWLDYEGPLQEDHLEYEIKEFFTKAPPGSIIFVTVNAQPMEDDELEEDQAHKDLLEDEFGSGHLPEGIDEYLYGPELSQAYRDIIMARIGSEFIPDRNAGVPVEEKVEFEQLINLVYTDTSLMFTFGGVILDSEKKELFSEIELDSYEFVSRNDDFYDLPQPELTFTETRILEEYMPNSYEELDLAIPKEDIEAFSEVYRYFPRFTESEL